MWLTILSILLALSSVSISVFLFLDSSQRPRRSELRELLEKQSENVLKQYLTQFHSLEAEWDDMYQKFGKLAGRMDRQKALASPEAPPAVEEVPKTRAELLRRFKAK